jgi:molybdopterin synthase sulfur carrier subunit
LVQVHFTAWLRDVAGEHPFSADAASVGEALTAVFAERPQLRGYVLDEQGRLRKHVCVFAGGARLPHETALGHAVASGSAVYVMQALSGG